MLLLSVFPQLVFAADRQTFINRIPEIFKQAEKTYQNVEYTTPLKKFPITTKEGRWVTTAPSGWTSGFLPGIYWLLYEQSHKTSWSGAARKRQVQLQSQQFNNTTHDVGFIIFESFGNGYRNIPREQDKKVLLNAGRTLAKRYNEKVGLIKSWETSQHQTIIDNMMNLELLFWGARNGGDPNWKKMAQTHALTTMRDFVRSDGSTYHVVTYNPSTGKKLGQTTAQGMAPTSVWARGQAWAIYGFAMAYRETKDPKFLRTAEKTADYFLDHLPKDKVPYWDFKAPQKNTEPRDSSAAAIAASGLLELAAQEPKQQQRSRFINGATDILSELASKNYYSGNYPSVLLHGTYNKRVGEYDSGTIWGDYYFLEALLKLQKIGR